MHKRRSHQKSRKGCQNCKRRHVKCDEMGPPCAACVARNTTDTCVYGPHRQRVKSDTPSSSSETPDSTLSPRPPAIDEGESKTRRLLEIQLMHRWMTHTWKSMASMPEDHQYLLESLPVCALKYDYLLYSTLSLCAMDLAMNGQAKQGETFDPRFWVETSMGYYDLASQALRPVLGNSNMESHIWIYMSSVFLTILQMTLPQCIQVESNEPQPTMVQRMETIFELFMANGKIALLDWEALWNGPMSESVQIATKLALTTPDTLDPDMEEVVRRLQTTMEQAHSPDTLPALQQSYKSVFTLLKLCFIEESRGIAKGFCIAVPMYCGQNFALAVKESQPMALFLLMHFGALLERLAKSGAWWAASVGQDLVQETSEILFRTQPQLMQVPEWWDGIAWARDDVGLPTVMNGIMM